MGERDPSVDVTFGLEVGTVVGVEGFLVALLQADNVCVVAEQLSTSCFRTSMSRSLAERSGQFQKTGGVDAPGAAVSENALRVRPRNVGVSEDVVGDHAEGRGFECPRRQLVSAVTGRLLPSGSHGTCGERYVRRYPARRKRTLFGETRLAVDRRSFCSVFDVSADRRALDSQ